MKHEAEQNGDEAGEGRRAVRGAETLKCSFTQT